MWKVVRNTFFTAAAIGLTVVGLRWNTQTVSQLDPLTIGRSVVAAQSLEDDPNFPLKIEFARPIVKLGQAQEMTIVTVPNAELEIVTIYPDGDVADLQTRRAVADNEGRFYMKYKLSDFRYLGIIRVAVVATSATKTAETSQVFGVQPWVADAVEEAQEQRYLHPLIP